MESKRVEILLVEDNEDDIIMTLEAFEEAKLVNIIHVVRDGEEALNYLRKKGKYQGVAPPGIILLDINMPKKSGFEVLQEIKADQKLQHIPVVMLTTSEREQDIVRSYAGGACSYIPKPVGFENFLRVARQFSFYWAVITRIPSPEL